MSFSTALCVSKLLRPMTTAQPYLTCFPAPLSCAVQGIMSFSTSLYVRHTLPLEQARTAMLEKGMQVWLTCVDSW